MKTDRNFLQYSRMKEFIINIDAPLFSEHAYRFFITITLIKLCSLMMIGSDRQEKAYLVSTGAIELRKNKELQELINW